MTQDPTDLPGPAWWQRLPQGVLLGAGVVLVASGFALGAVALTSSSSDAPGTTPSAPAPTAEPPPRSIPEVQTDADAPVRLEVGTDLQATIDQYAPGTEFVIAAGIHREQWIRPRDGDVFRGEDGAVLNGARVLEGFEAVDGRWRIGGQTQSLGPIESTTLPGREIVKRFEELFLDDDRLERVASLAEVGPGTWFLDDEADTIWMGDDPTGRRVETSVTPWAFREPRVADVTIENVTVERYANRSSRGAVNPDDSPRWTIRRVTARQNHGAGIGIGPGTVVENADIVDNGQIGLAGNCDFRDGQPNAGESILVEIRDSRIRDNGRTGFDWAWEGGALKIKFCTAGVVFENNWVHDNSGPGIWLDIDNADAVVRRNLAERNSVTGIFYEISFGPALIEHNISRDNGGDPRPAGLEAGIVVSNSTGVVVRENLVTGSPAGLLVRHTDRGVSGFGGERVSDDIRFEDNVVAFERGTGVDARFEAERVRDEFDIRFTGNSYLLDDPTAAAFLYDDREMAFADWQDLGFDVEGSVAALGTSPPTLPDGVPTFEQQPSYGATPAG